MDVTALLEHAPRAVNALTLAMARMVGCVQFLPLFGRRHMSMLHRNSICLALGLSQVWLLWQTLGSLQPIGLLSLALKEAVLGCVLGLLLALPFWAVAGAWTLVDNQRGANSAQMQNPSLQADASILGELGERLIIVLIVESGGLVACYAVLADSYRLWPVLAPFPAWTAELQSGVIAAFAQLMADAPAYAGPAIALMLAIDLALALGSNAAQGVDVYQAAMPVKGLVALFLLAVASMPVLDHARDRVLGWWVDQVLHLLPK